MAENKYQLQLIDAMSYAANGHDSATDWAELYAKLGELGQTKEELELTVQAQNLILNKLVNTLVDLTGCVNLRSELGEWVQAQIELRENDPNHIILMTPLNDVVTMINQRIERAEEAGHAVGFQTKMREILDSLPR